MGTLTITAKGQVTLRKDLLQHLGVLPGEKVSVAKLPDVFNLLKRKNGPRLSIKQINEVAARGWRGK